MLRFLGPASTHCDRITRRDCLTLGALGLGGLTLPGLLRLRAAAGETAPARRDAAVIFVELAGGPSHFETYDPKPDAPREYRGPMHAIETNVPGVFFSELMQEQARLMDRLAIIRSVHHNSSSHQTSSHLVQTGYYLRQQQNRDNEMPSVGAVAARVCGANQPAIPAYVAIPRATRSGGAAFLGKACNPFETTNDPSKPNFRVNNLEFVKNVGVKRLDDRRQLLSLLENARRNFDAPVVDNHGVTGAIDDFTREAFEMVTGKEARRAFDIGSEDPRLRDHYGRSPIGQGLLLARRLVEAGVTFVTVRQANWDDHAQIARKMRDKGPAYDQAMAALVADIYERGLDRDVLVVAMGEFGRTPRVNRSAGRDHWGSVMSVLMSGGGLRVGQVVGSSNSKGEVPATNPYRPENVLATIYRHLGIDTAHTFDDFAGRPRYVLEQRDVIRELI